MAIEAAGIKFGDIDARHEILARDPSKRRLFLDAFFVPDEQQLNDMRLGEKFIIIGPKGCGKTAYLRFLHHSLDENKNSKSKFILFRDDVTSQDREKILPNSKLRLYDNGDDDENSEFVDCVASWQLFIHREIAEILSRSAMCAKTSDVINYIGIIERFFANNQGAKFRGLLSRIKKGRAKLGPAGMELEAEFVDQEGNVDISEMVRYCNGVVSNLHFDSELKDSRINIFFDEINISFVSGSDFKRNAILIRDLVSACGIMNTIFAERNLPIYIYTAIRSDVVDSVEGSVRELKKWVDDKGVYLDWYTSGIDYKDQPIIQLLKKRIQANEKSLDPTFSKEIILENYFEKKISDRPIADFLIFESWARPRDLVRLLGEAAKFVSKGSKFNANSFQKSKSTYSLGSWEEKKDELNSKYAQGDIDNIKRILTGFKVNFTLPAFFFSFLLLDFIVLSDG